MSVVEDISARKQAEQDLRHHREHLEQLVRDRTAELEATHEQLRLADRMASIGTLAAGLGHDMGNLLLPLRMRLEALESLETSEESAAEIAGIRASVDYLERLADGLRLLVLDPKRARPHGTVELHAWWNDALPMVRNAVPQPIAIRSEFPPGECWIGIDDTSLTQIVFNLVQNAGNAMKERASGLVRVCVERAESAVQLRVSDDGPGMTEEVRRRCVEPFFTTRPREISTGLGLVLVYGLVKQFGGSVRIESEPGVGTSFILTLPVARFAPRSGGSSRPIASIVIRDQRLRALVAAELDRLEFEVRPEAPGHEGHILVTDESDETALHQLARSHPHRRIALIGPAPAGGVPDRILASGSSPNTSDVRDLLKRVALSSAFHERATLPPQS